jgi:X-X-X-Leu-X-X-Gly heptad repeat protein
MAVSEIRQVLANWIEQANSGTGRLSDGIDPSDWVAKQFTKWWQAQVDDPLGDAESAAHRLREELARINDPERLDEAMHELTHIQDALADLRNRLGLSS